MFIISEAVAMSQIQTSNEPNLNFLEDLGYPTFVFSPFRSDNAFNHI